MISARVIEAVIGESLLLQWLVVSRGWVIIGVWCSSRESIKQNSLSDLHHCDYISLGVAGESEIASSRSVIYLYERGTIN